jgi:hypothetical protein
MSNLLPVTLSGINTGLEVSAATGGITPIADGGTGLTTLGPSGTVLASNGTVLFYELGYLTPQQFGAVGNGIANDTVAMQAWLTAVGAGTTPGYIPPGTYLINSAITCTGGGPVNIFGPGFGAAAVIKLGSTTQDGLVLNPPASVNDIYVDLRDFGITGATSASSGACLNFIGAQSVVRLSNLIISSASVGIRSTIHAGGMGPESSIDKCQVSASDTCIELTDFGDSSITGCLIFPGSTAVGIASGGNPAGTRIMNCKFNSSTASTGIDIEVGATDGDLFIIGNSIEGCNTVGINVQRPSGSFTFANVVISGNEIGASTGNGMNLGDGTGANWLSILCITGNVIQISANKTAISLGDIVNGFTITGNCITNGSTGGTGVSATGTATGVIVGNSITAATVTSVPGSVIVADNASP